MGRKIVIKILVSLILFIGPSPAEAYNVESISNQCGFNAVKLNQRGFNVYIVLCAQHKTKKNRLNNLLCHLSMKNIDMDEFSIREAKEDDKEEVLAIHKNVSGGFDYLPEFYDYFLSAKNAKSFVLLHGGKIVST